jgi:hypothetical protein
MRSRFALLFIAAGRPIRKRDTVDTRVMPQLSLTLGARRRVHLRTRPRSGMVGGTGRGAQSGFHAPSCMSDLCCFACNVGVISSERVHLSHRAHAQLV